MSVSRILVHINKYDNLLIYTRLGRILTNKEFGLDFSQATFLSTTTFFAIFCFQ